MKFRDKLMAGYLLAAALITMSGLFGIYGTEKIVTLLESKDMVVRSIVISASILARNAKSLESNLLIYLMFGNKEFKENYFRQVTELREAERSLRQVVQDPHGMRILDLVKSESDLAVTAGRALLDSFDASVETNSTYVASDHKDLITAFVETTRNIRRQAMKLADIETNFLNRQEAITASMEIASYSKRLQGHLILYLLLQNSEERRKVFDRYQSFYEMISVLDDKLIDPAARKILNEIRIEMEQMMPAVQELLNRNDSSIANKGFPSPEHHEALIRKVCALTNSLGNKGVALARLNVHLETEPQNLALERVRFVQLTILVVTVIPIILASILGYVANRKATELAESKSELEYLNNALDERSNELTIANEQLKAKILDHEKAEEEKSNLIIELREALAEVKKLSGFLPICSSCKKIRDDKGYWSEVEQYVSAHSDAEFSHSICPDCMRSLYPEYADAVLDRLEKDEKK